MAASQRSRQLINFLIVAACVWFILEHQPASSFIPVVPHGGQVRVTHHDLTQIIHTMI